MAAQWPERQYRLYRLYTKNDLIMSHHFEISVVSQAFVAINKSLPTLSVSGSEAGVNLPTASAQFRGRSELCVFVCANKEKYWTDLKKRSGHRRYVRPALCAPGV